MPAFLQAQVQCNQHNLKQSRKYVCDPDLGEREITMFWPANKPPLWTYMPCA